MGGREGEWEGCLIKNKTASAADGISVVAGIEQRLALCHRRSGVLAVSWPAAAMYLTVLYPCHAPTGQPATAVASSARSPTSECLFLGGDGICAAAAAAATAAAASSARSPTFASSSAVDGGICADAFSSSVPAVAAAAASVPSCYGWRVAREGWARDSAVTEKGGRRGVGGDQRTTEEMDAKKELC